MAISKGSVGCIFVTINGDRRYWASLFDDDHSFFTISYLATWYSKIKTITIKRPKLHQLRV